jgi:hypothetical protein
MSDNANRPHIWTIGLGISALVVSAASCLAVLADCTSRRGGPNDRPGGISSRR